MIGRTWKKAACSILACCLLAAPVGCQTVAPVTITPPQAAIDLSGTYMIAVTGGGSQSDLGSDPTLVIANGLLTRLGVTDLIPQSITANTPNFLWTSAASIVLSASLPFPVATTVTLNADLQGNGTLVGTITFTALGQTSAALNVTLTKQ